MNSKQLEVPIKQYKVFKSCKFDGNWNKEHDFAHSYSSSVDGAKVQICASDGTGTLYRFKKNSTVIVRDGFLEFLDKDLLKE